MRRLLPFPLLAATLFALWVLLTDFSPGHILFAAVVALVAPRVMLVLRAERPRIRLGMAAARLAASVRKAAMTQNSMSLPIDAAARRANKRTVRRFDGGAPPGNPGWRAARRPYGQVSGVQLPSGLRQAVPRAVWPAPPV